MCLSMLPTSLRRLDQGLLPSNPLVTPVPSPRPSSPCKVDRRQPWQWLLPSLSVLVSRLAPLPLALAFLESGLRLLHQPRGHTLQPMLPQSRYLPPRVRLCIAPVPTSRRSLTRDYYRAPSQLP